MRRILNLSRVVNPIFQPSDRKRFVSSSTLQPWHKTKEKEKQKEKEKEKKEWKMSKFTKYFGLPVMFLCSCALLPVDEECYSYKSYPVRAIAVFVKKTSLNFLIYSLGLPYVSLVVVVDDITSHWRG